MRASVIIAAFNEGGSLAKTIRSCVESCEKLSYEIIVADDASTDDSVERAMAEFPQTRFTRHQRRRGASPTKHLGAQDARGEVLVFLDGHCKPESGAIRQLVEDVELLEGDAIVTPAIPALDVGQWKNDPRQVGRGYRMDLKTFGCGWLPRGRMRAVQEGRRKFFESPALIGCALAISRSVYDRLWGFDAHMRVWGVEDLDFGLKCWLMGGRILHDSDARVGHRFRRRFDNYDVPPEHVLVNQLRMARKHFTESVWAEWLDLSRQRHPGRLPEHPEGLWARVWQLFEQDRSSVEEERSYLQANRARDEFWYAKRFGLNWPHLAAEGAKKFRGPLSAEDPSGSPLHVPVLPPETHLADRHPRGRAGLFSRGAPASRADPAQATETAYPLRPEAPGQAVHVRLDVHQGRSPAPARARRRGAGHLPVGRQVIAAIQTHGELLHWHPHFHVLVTCGAFTPQGEFLELPEYQITALNSCGKDKRLGRCARSASIQKVLGLNPESRV